MLFVEFRFFWFFLAVFAVYWSLRRNDSRKFWLLICSYFFYACWNWKFLFLIMASTALDYFVGAMLARTTDLRARRGWLVLSLVANLGTIAFFKYYNSSSPRPASSNGSACPPACHAEHVPVG